MTRIPPSPSVRLAVRLYALLARGLPRAFRDTFGREMLLDVEDILADRWMRSGTGAMALGLGRALWDLGIRVARERVTGVVRWAGLEKRRGGAGRSPKEPNEGLDREIFGLNLRERTMNVMRELRLAVRSLSRKPGFAAVGVLTLGLGMGSVLAIFTLVNAILLQPLPYPEADRIVEIEHHAPNINLPDLNNSSGTLYFYREAADVFQAVVGINQASRVLTGLDQPERVTLLMATPEFFTVFATQPVIGRPFGEADAVEGAAPVAVLLHDAWQSRFGGDPDIVGSTIQLDGVATEVIGVMPSDFELIQPGPIGIQAWYPGPPVFGTFGTTGLARLAPGVTLEQATAQIEALQTRIPEFTPEIDLETLESFGWSASIMTLREDVVEDVATTLWLVLGTVGFVLLIACANVANLFLVRAEDRQKEIAVRAAMGAGRGSVAASFIYESLVLGLTGGLFGVAVAYFGVDLLVANGPENLPRLHEIAITPTVLAFGGLLAVATGVLLGLLPMTRYSAKTFASILRDGGRGSTVGRGRNRARSALVMSQLALALILLVGSGLMFRSFAEMRAVELGFETENILTVGIQVGEGMERQEAARFYEQLQERVAGLPGVRQVGVTTQVPLASGNMNGGSFYIESQPRAEDDLPPVAYYRAVAPGYFESMGIEVVRGETMAPADMDGSRAKVWIDEHFAETIFGGEAIGERIAWTTTGDPEADAAAEHDWAEIVGITRNMKHLGIREDPQPQAFLPMVAGVLAYPGLQVGFLTVRVDSGMDAATLMPSVREEISRLNGQVPIIRAQTMEEVVSASMAGESITLVLLGIAAGMALFLGSIGLFGVISYVVSQRTREIGVRIALGAEAGEVAGMVLKQGFAVTTAGVVLGLAGAFGLTRLMGSLLYEVSATDPATFVIAPIALLAVATLATWLPARRASKVDPIESLREE